MFVDIFCGTNILSEWTIWLGLPILAHSGANPWIYAFHHGEMRIAAGKIAEDLLARFGVTPVRYGCSPIRRGSNTNLELDKVNNSDERQPVEDCFAAKQHSCNPYTSRRCLEMSGKHTEIPFERRDSNLSSESCREGTIVEESIHDLTKMLDPKYIIDRNHAIDSNHNIEKIKNLKYLLDPTFNKIRHLRRLNHKRMPSKYLKKNDELKFTSFQNLNDDENSKKKSLQLNTMSDPVLNSNSPVDTKHLTYVLYYNSIRYQRKDSNLSSLSDPNIKIAIGASDSSLKLFSSRKITSDDHRFSIQNLDHQKYEPSLAKSLVQCRHLENQRKLSQWARPKSRLVGRILDSLSPTVDLRYQNTCYSSMPDPKCSSHESKCFLKKKNSLMHFTITSNKLANLYDTSSGSLENKINPQARLPYVRKIQETLKHSESTFDTTSHSRFLGPCQVIDSLNVPIIHSEPPSPIDRLPLVSLQEEEPKCININPLRPHRARKFKRPTRHSDPIIPAALLNTEDFSRSPDHSNERLHGGWSDASSNTTPSLDPNELTEALLRDTEHRMESRALETIFAEHDSTRYSSRRPSDSKWSESSRSQEVLSNITEYQKFPSSYSVNNFQNCNSGSDFNDVTPCLDPFTCPDALSSSLRESFFGAPSAPDSDIFNSFEKTDEYFYKSSFPTLKMFHSSVSSMNLHKTKISNVEAQSRSTESVFQNEHSFNKTCKILRLEPYVHRKGRIRPYNEYILEDYSTKKTPRLAPLATPTPTDICTPTFDIVLDIKNDSGVGVRV